MACSEWEESALLYCSDELDQDMKKKFETHIAECEGCKSFYGQYKKECSSLFTVDVLGELPSENVSKELLRVCSNTKKQYTSAGIFSSVAKKSFVSVSFFLIGFIVVGYFMMNVHQANVKQENVARENDMKNSPSVSQSVTVANSKDQIETPKDSINSLPDSNRYFSKTRGNLDANGVIPVDLINK